MDKVTLTAFGDELVKIAGFLDFWRRIFRGGEDERARLRVNYHFSPRAGDDKWDKFLKNVTDSRYLRALGKHEGADDKLLQHAQSMHDLLKGEPQGRVYSQQLPGRSYEIRRLPSGELGCTCPDWRFKGSVNTGYECKHILAHKAGKTKPEG